ncbi:cytochrome c3 family protein, partial [Methylocystis sp. MJC1]|uniref:cytochrome c3 family protein n=2 Tax=Methylocystis sp. MJC1 TaxID=2654282 RepID=UPI0019D1A6C0
QTTPPHIPVAGVQCSNCHSNTASSFKTYTMSHAAVSAARCDSCHNGSYVGEGTKGAQGTASYPGHVAVAGRDCKSCHATAATTFTSWAGGVYQHQASDTNCSSCHNGTTATGQTTPPHIPVAGVQCSNCHS